MLLKRLTKSRSLRITNLLGLVTIFCCLLLSYAFVKKELSYDRFHENADRIARFSMQWDNEPVDVRNWGTTKNSPYINQIAGVEDVVMLDKVNTGVLTIGDVPRIVNNFYFASSNFFDVFSFNLLEGDPKTVLNAPEKVAVSKDLAKQLFGNTSPVGKEIRLSGRKFNDKTVFISGVFDNFPETSHFHTDLIVHRPDSENRDWAYVYLLMEPNVDLNQVEQTIAAKMDELNAGSEYHSSPLLFPLTEIHLHSHFSRELEINGNINYIYLIVSANLLLLIIVLFNLWLNSGLIFSFNKKYYQLLRLNGASSGVVLRDETVMAVLSCCLAILVGGMLSFVLSPELRIPIDLSAAEIGGLAVAFLLTITLVSVMPVLTRMSSTLFRYNQNEQKVANFTLGKVKYMLIGQYCIVMFVVIIGFSINRQMELIEKNRVGGTERSILVMKEQPEAVQQRYDVLKNELMNHPEIEMVTSAMQLPGSAIRDLIEVQVEGEGESNYRKLPILVVGDDFLPFFQITPVAGTVFKNNPLSYRSEQTLFNDFRKENRPSDVSEEYMINRKALQVLGFGSPGEAIGKIVHLRHGALDYINKGRIVGVTEDYNYTTAFEETQPQLLMQRKNFQHCIMVGLSSSNTEQALSIFNQVWHEVNPDYPADYTFLLDVYDKVYHNEVKAKSLARIFSLLCLIIANLGLIIITSFIIKRKTKEIGVRKVNGATPADIIRMLNNRFALWIGFAFLISVPFTYLIILRWLEQFAYKAVPNIWTYAFSGLLVLSLAMIAISWQSWKAATINPINALKTE